VERSGAVLGYWALARRAAHQGRALCCAGLLRPETQETNEANRRKRMETEKKKRMAPTTKSI